MSDKQRRSMRCRGCDFETFEVADAAIHSYALGAEHGTYVVVAHPSRKAD